MSASRSSMIGLRAQAKKRHGMLQLAAGAAHLTALINCMARVICLMSLTLLMRFFDFRTAVP
jgi:hypothetical protein